MENILEILSRGVGETLAEAKRNRPESLLLERIAHAPARPSFLRALRKGEGGFRVIAELKKASPSRGVIREEFDVPALADELARSGAAALSVLTEEKMFLGSLENLRLAARTVPLPLLRKDFIIDPYQILEAKADGASAVLLIAALIEDDSLLRALAERAAELGLDVLGEAHDEREIERILRAGIVCVGVNARDLRTFRTDLLRVEGLLKRIPSDRTAVAESALSARSEMERLAAAGADGFLIGEALMRAPHPGDVLRSLLGEDGRRADS